MTTERKNMESLLFGRRTYEIFAGVWGAMADPSDSPIALALKTQPKSNLPFRPA